MFGNIYADLSLLKYFSLRNEVSYLTEPITGHQLAGTIGTTTLGSQLVEYRGNSYYYAIEITSTSTAIFGKHGVSIQRVMKRSIWIRITKAVKNKPAQ